MGSFDFVCLLAQPQYDAYRELCCSSSTWTFRESEDWEQMSHDLLYGKVPAAAICGLLYKKLRSMGCPLQPVASPVLRGERYQGRSGYWADLVVRADSKLTQLSELRGKTWLFNETDSYSGYRALLSELKRQGLGADFLGEQIETGSHAESLRRLGHGEGDFTVLDSSFFEGLASSEREAYRRVHSIGPKPAPLVVCLPGYERELCSLWEGQELPELFTSFVEVTDRDYDVLVEDWNLGLELLGAPGAVTFVTEDEGVPSREFTRLEQARKDQAVLRETVKEVYQLFGTEPTKEIRGGKFYCKKVDGLERHTYVMQPEGLKGKNLAIVGFFSRMKPDGDLPALFEADSKIVELFYQYPGMLIYAPKEYEPGVWGNLVIFENRDAQRDWASNAPHVKAIRDLTADSYENIRLHVGVWTDQNQPFHWVCTKYLNYTEEGLWRGVRCYRPLKDELSPH